MSVWATARAACAALATLLAAACAPLPTTPDAGAGGAEPTAGATAVTGAATSAAESPRPHLLPLDRQAPAAAEAPRSRVVQIFPDLSETPDGPPDDLQVEEFERGGGSWYGVQFHRRRTASGELFDMTGFTAAHKTLPFGTKVCVRSLVNGREVLVYINDRGPFTPGRIIDLSQAAAEQIQLTTIGFKQVSLTVVPEEGGRCAGERVEGGLAPINMAAAPRPAPARRAPARVVNKRRR